MKNLLGFCSFVNESSDQLSEIIKKTYENKSYIGHPILVVGNTGTGKLKIILFYLDELYVDSSVIYADRLSVDDTFLEEPYETYEDDHVFIINEFDKASLQVQTKLLEEIANSNKMVIILVSQIPKGLDTALMNKMIRINT